MEYELYHYGTKNMRWGIRLYQNKDGTLTPAGKARYAKMREKQKREEQVLKNKERTKAKIEKLNAKEKELEARRKALADEDKKESPKTEDKPASAEAPKPATAANTEHKPNSNPNPAPKQTTTPNTSSKKSVKEMSDEELNVAIARIRLENTYRELNPEKVSKGRKFAEALGSQVLAPVAIDIGKKVATAMAINFINSSTGLNISSNQGGGNNNTKKKQGGK